MSAGKIVFWCGFLLWGFSFLSGFELLAEMTGWKIVNTLTKDQVSMMFGFVFIVMAKLSKVK